MSTPDPAVTDWVPLWSPGTLSPYVPSCCAYANANLSQPSGSSGVIPLNSEAWDTDGMHDTVTNNSRITIRTAGFYSFVASGTFAPNTVGNHRLLAFILNGNTTWIETGGVVGSFPGGAVRMQVSMIRQFLQVGDYIELVTYQDSGGPLTLSHDWRGGPEVCAAYLGPGIPAGAWMPPSYGTSFPASPADGQEHVLVDSVSNPTYQWRFRFNAGHTSDAYKWEFVGGAPMTARYDASQSSGANAWNAGQPQLTMARAGLYVWTWSGRSSSVGQLYIAIDLDLNTTRAAFNSPGSENVFGRAGVPLAVPTAGTVVRAFFYNTAAASYDNVMISALPVRVS